MAKKISCWEQNQVHKERMALELNCNVSSNLSAFASRVREKKGRCDFKHTI